MPKITNSLGLVTKQDIPSLKRVLQTSWQQATGVVNGNLSFGDGVDSDNINGKWVNFITPTTPDTDFFIIHNLGRLPVGYQIHMKSVAADLYNGSQPATDTRICLRSNIGNVEMRVFIL